MDCVKYNYQADVPEQLQYNIIDDISIVLAANDNLTTVVTSVAAAIEDKLNIIVKLTFAFILITKIFHF